MILVNLGFVLVGVAFVSGLVIAIVDINRFSFGLYLVLVCVVVAAVLSALCVMRPQACQTHNFAAACWRCTFKSSPKDPLVRESPVHVPLLNNIQAVPMLIQAIQVSMERFACAPLINLPNNSDSARTEATDVRISLETFDQTKLETERFNPRGLSPIPSSRNVSREEYSWEESIDNTNTWMNARLNLELITRRNLTPPFPLAENSKKESAKLLRRSSSCDNCTSLKM